MLRVNPRAIVGKALAEVFRPPDLSPPSIWAPAHLIVPDGPRAGQPFDLAQTPYLREPLDMLGPESPHNEIAIMKSAQSGLTLMLIAFLGYVVDRMPCRVMVIQPTDSALAEFNREKLDPAFRNSPALRRKVESQTSRSGQGSTTYSKKFPGGSITLAIATSAADLRSKTVRVLLRDEIDQYPDDLDGQGDPLEISDARLISFLASATWRKADVSTPTIKGASKIERRFEAGDQRRWHVRCPQCGNEFVFEWGPYFKFEKTVPYRAYYVAPCCGGVIEYHQKLAIVREGRWIAGAPRPGAFPSYHFDALSSPFVPWDSIAKAYAEAGDDPQRQKTFHNLWLGLPFEVRGDAPDYLRLMERREKGLLRGRVPPAGVLLVAAADVQMRGVWVEILALAPTRETWVVDAFYCDGATDAPGSLNDAPDSGNALSLMLRQTIGREFPDAFGRVRQLDALGIDSGYRSHIVYATVVNNQRLHPDSGHELLLALDGRDGWNRPPIGVASYVDIALDGRPVKANGARLFPVGSWSLKGVVYADLRKEAVRGGGEAYPPGYCHFPDWLDETYFKQLTAEYVAETKSRGRTKKYWKQRPSQKDNHFLDCRVYNMALAEHLGLSSITADGWARLAHARGVPQAETLPLFYAAARALEPGENLPIETAPPIVDYGEEADARFARLWKANAARFR